MRGQLAADELGERGLEIVGLFQLARELHQLVRDGGVEHGVDT